MTVPRARIAVEDLSVTLGTRPVLSGITLDIAPGTLCALTGPNGAGKTTLLRAMAGLLEVTGGRVRVESEDDHASSRPLCAFLPQDRAVHWSLTAERVVMLGRLPHQKLGSGESETDRLAVAKALADMDASHLAARPVDELSGGERARVLLARALAQETPVLLADEPTAALDLAHQLTLFEHFRQLARAGRTVVVALHDLSLAARYADTAALLAEGRLMSFGPPADVLSPRNIADAYGVDIARGNHDGIPYLLPAAVLPQLRVNRPS